MFPYSLDGNGVYPKAYENMMSGNIDLSSLVEAGDLKAALVDDSYEAVSTDEFFDSVIDSVRIATNGQVNMTEAVLNFQTIDSCTPMCGGYLSSSATVFTAVDPSLDEGTVGNIVLYIDGDNPGTNDYLIGLFMRDKNGDLISVTPDGDDITINWDTNINRFLGCIFAWGFAYC